VRKRADRTRVFTSFLVFIFIIFGPLCFGQVTNVSTRQAAPFDLEVDPSVSWPVWDSDLFSVGGGATLAARFGFLTTDLHVGPELGYTIQPLASDAGNLSVVSLGANASYSIRPIPRLSITPSAEGGYFLGVLDSGTIGRSLFFGGALAFDLAVSKSFNLGLSGGYRDYFGLYQTLDLGLDATVRLGMSSGSGLEFDDASFEPVFPVLFKYYDDHPVGKVTIKNGTGSLMKDVKVSFYVNEYMDNPKLCATIPSIDAGVSSTVDLLALFNDKMLSISEGTKVSAKVSVEYTQKGIPAAKETTGTIRIYDRNASMWDDNRKAAAFVTSKDPTVLRFAKNVLSMIKNKGSKAVNPNLLTAMAMHEATLIYGLTYITDPSNSYAATLESKTAVDFLQFPRQTLDYKGGNCSALSILYTSLLESVGVETAFITVPGHIFMAVSLGIAPDQARKDFGSPDDLIITSDHVWLPIETTERSAGFIQAWQDAAKEWRENLAKQQTELYPVHEAWSVYEPVGFSSDMESIALPDADKVVASYLEELVRYIDSEIYPQVAKFQAEIKSTNNAPSALNKLGVLYGRYGLLDRAAVQFRAALKDGPYAPALVNLGNIQYLDQKYEAALDYFNQAQKLAPNSPGVLLAVARVNHVLENYAAAKVAYEKLKAKDAVLAQQFSYLDLKESESTRAADIAGINDIVVWGDQ
jgi:tetratricopeptide (TPR) repeat protein